MVNVQQCLRLVVFAYITFLPIFLSLWCITLLPEIIDRNLGYHEVKDQSTIAGYFFTFFFYGLIVGSFIWPYLVKFSSKRNMIFIALILQSIFNAFQWQYRSIYWLCFCRFIVGFMHNLNTVGKDFIFEFADLDHRQYAFSFKSCFGIFASFVGPYIGYYIYQLSGQSFALSSFYISLYFYVPALLGFIILFYCNYIPGEIEDKIALQKQVEQNEDLIQLAPKESEVQQREGRGLWGVFKHCLINKEIRGYILVYIISNGVFKTGTMIIIFFMEQNWNQEGLGVSSKNTSIVNLISYFPSAIILMYSPKLVPSIFSYKSYIKTMVLILASSILIMPLLRDIFTYDFVQNNPWFVYGDLIFYNCFNPKLFSPFVNYVLNSKIDRNDRTSINAVTFISSTLSSSLLINIFAPLYAYTLGSKFFQNIQPFNKYIAFASLSLLLIIGQSFMVNVKRQEEETTNKKKFGTCLFIQIFFSNFNIFFLCFFF